MSLQASQQDAFTVNETQRAMLMRQALNLSLILQNVLEKTEGHESTDPELGTRQYGGGLWMRLS